MGYFCTTFSEQVETRDGPGRSGLFSFFPSSTSSLCLLPSLFPLRWLAGSPVFLGSGQCGCLSSAGCFLQPVKEKQPNMHRSKTPHHLKQLQLSFTQPTLTSPLLLSRRPCDVSAGLFLSCAFDSIFTDIITENVQHFKTTLENQNSYFN